ncbi:MAG TPA: PASTA domain-containing protein [Kofleriaceae bacterium]|nr:PASTA domain-containing protein [Kofleriaceae bacterium]
MKILTTAMLLSALLGCKSLIKTSTSVNDSPAGSSSSSSGDVVVPDLTGKTEEEALAAVKAAGFRTEAEAKPLSCDGAPEVEGQVNCQSPAPGETVKAYAMVQYNVYRTQRISGAVVRDQLAALLGKTPTDARKLLESYGHDGRVKVEPDSKFHDGCADGRICDFSVSESGMGIHDEITLYTNPKLSISGPPPE